MGGGVIISLLNFKSTIERKLDELHVLKNDYNDDVYVGMAIAECSFLRGNRLEALQLYQDIISSDGKNIEARINIAVIYILQKLYKEGFEELFNIVKNEPFDIFSYFLYKYFSSRHPVPEDFPASFSEIKAHEFSLKELQIILMRIENIIDFVNIEIADYDEISRKQKEQLVFRYIYELALRRKEHLQDAYDYALGMKNAILDQVRAEEEERLAVQRRREEEEEARRVEEENKRLEQQRLIEEQERLKAEEELRRLEEEKRLESELAEKYSKICSVIEPEIQAFVKNKGVIGSVLFNREGNNISSCFNEAADETKLISFANSAIEKISQHRLGNAESELVYWVLEFERGLIAIRLIGSGHVFLTLAGSGANFGVLRFSIEKIKDSIEQSLKSIDA